MSRNPMRESTKTLFWGMVFMLISLLSYVFGAGLAMNANWVGGVLIFGGIAGQFFSLELGSKSTRQRMDEQ